MSVETAIYTIGAYTWLYNVLVYLGYAAPSSLAACELAHVCLQLSLLGRPHRHSDLLAGYLAFESVVKESRLHGALIAMAADRFEPTLSGLATCIDLSDRASKHIIAHAKLEYTPLLLAARALLPASVLFFARKPSAICVALTAWTWCSVAITLLRKKSGRHFYTLRYLRGGESS